VDIYDRSLVDPDWHSQGHPATIARSIKDIRGVTFWVECPDLELHVKVSRKDLMLYLEQTTATDLELVKVNDFEILVSRRRA
jgi:hypothetical protein